MAKRTPPPIQQDTVGAWKQILRDAGFDIENPTDGKVKKALEDAEAGRVSRLMNEQSKATGSFRRKA